jgi:hypothetical protein
VRLRWVTGLLALTLPIWLVPYLLVVGWREAGRDLVADFPKAMRWAVLGRNVDA